jgi:hypothetical protein
MNDRTNYSGHYSGPTTAPRPQGIIFRFSGTTARYCPYMWLNYADYEAAEQIKLDFGRYDVVVRGTESDHLNKVFEAVTRHECGEILEAGSISIEIIEKEEAEAR